MQNYPQKHGLLAPDFTPEYHYATSFANPYWRAVRWIAFGVTLGRCVILPIFRARDLDHLHYRNLGHELPLFDVVPLSRPVHVVVTYLRRMGLKFPVNLALRVAYAGWIAAWVLAGAFALHWFHLISWDPAAFLMGLPLRAQDAWLGLQNWSTPIRNLLQ